MNQTQSEMNKPLIEKDSIEFSITNRKKTINRKVERSRDCSTQELPNTTEELSAIAKFQVFDVSTDFDPLFEQQNVPSAFYPKQIKKFKSNDVRHTWLDQVLDFIPVFHPESLWLLLWQFCMVILILFYFYYIPFKIAFSDKTDEFQSFKFINYFIRFSIFVLFIDVMVSFNIGFFDFGILIKDRRRIAVQYLKWAFELDFMGVLCLILALALSNDYIRLLFYVRAYYVFRFNDKIEKIIQLRRSKKKKKYLLHQKDFKAIYGLFKLFFGVLFVTHIFGCLFYGIAIISINNNNSQYTWLYNSDFLPNGIEIYEEDLFQRYYTSFYWALTTVSTVGYGDITPKNGNEVLVAMITMLIAGMVFAFNVSSIRETWIEMQENSTRFNGYMVVINRYMELKKISEDTRVRIREYLEYLWSEEKHRNHSMENTLISTLPPELKEQLYAEAYKSFLNSSSFYFQDYSDTFLKQISQDMEETHYGSGEIIFEQSHGHYISQDHHLYYIVQGRVLMYLDADSSQGDHEIKIELIQDTQCFGEVSFFTDEPQLLNAKSLVYTTLYRLNRPKFIEKLKENPLDFQRFQILLAKRHTPEFYEMIGVRCKSCSEYGHLTLYCPATHYVADPEQLFSNKALTVPDINDRQSYFRQRPRPKANVWIMAKSLKNIASDVLATSARRSQLQRRATDFKVTLMGGSEQQIIPGLEELKEVEENDKLLGENDYLKQQIDDLRELIIKISDKLGIKQTQQLPNQEQIVIVPFYPASKFFFLNSFFLSTKEPVFDPNEITLDIDVIKNYEVFYPQFNFNRIVFNRPGRKSRFRFKSPTRINI